MRLTDAVLFLSEKLDQVLVVVTKTESPLEAILIWIALATIILVPVVILSFMSDFMLTARVMNPEESAKEVRRLAG